MLLHMGDTVDELNSLIQERDALQARVADLEAALLPFAIANDPDCTIWKRAVSAGSVRLARGVLGQKEGE